MLWESTSSPFVESINPLKSNAALEKKKKSLRRSVQNLLQLPVFAQEICWAKSSTTASYQTTVFLFQQLYFTTIIDPEYMYNMFSRSLKNTCHQRILRQTKCLLSNFWMIKFTGIPKKAIWHLAIWQHLCFGQFYHSKIEK